MIGPLRAHPTLMCVFVLASVQELIVAHSPSPPRPSGKWEEPYGSRLKPKEPKPHFKVGDRVTIRQRRRDVQVETVGSGDDAEEDQKLSHLLFGGTERTVEDDNPTKRAYSRHACVTVYFGLFSFFPFRLIVLTNA